MRESLDEPVSVVFFFDFHHVTKKGAVTIHHFSISDVDETAYFKIALDTSNLHWSNEEYMYGSESAVHYA